MASDPSSIENELRELHAAPLDELLLSRLEACTDGTITQLDPLELEFEQRLRGSIPTQLSPDQFSALEIILGAVPYPVAIPKIVAFPGRETTPVRRFRHQRQWWGAAAAVALLGAFAGWWIPAGAPPQPIVNSAPAAPLIRSSAATQLVPASFNRGLSEARDEGVIWQSSKQPHRVLKVVYRESVTLKDASGRTYQVEQPRVEYILVPAKTD